LFVTGGINGNLRTSLSLMLNK